jgi:exosortase
MKKTSDGVDVARKEMFAWFVLPFLAALALIYVLYADMFRNWWLMWVEPGSFYAHAAFVPFFVGIMIYRNREKLAARPWKPSWLGLALLIPAMGLLLLAKRIDVTVAKSLTFVLLLLAGSLLLAGWPKTRILLFPLAFIIAMIPLFPDQLINVVAFPIQLKSTQLATAMLNLFQLHAVREGTLIRMDSYRMAVEGACSGFRTLVSLLTFSAAFAYVVEGAVWKRWTLFLVTMPLSLFINALRIFFIGVVGELISMQAAQHFHDFSGFIVLILAFLFLFNFARVLRCERFLGVPLDDEPLPEPKADAEAAAPSEEEAPPGPTIPWWKPILEWRPTGSQMRRVLPFILAVDMTLLATYVAQGHVRKKVVEEPPIATSQVPLKLAANGVSWSVLPDPTMDKLSPDIQSQLNPRRVVSRHYIGTDGGQMEFFMTAGNGRWTFHDPHNCSLGSDAELQDIGVVSIPTPEGTLPVLEARYHRSGSPDTFEMMFCYVANGKVLQRTEQMHKALVWQTFFGDDGKPSYFLRFTQDAAGTEEEKRAQLQRFIGAMWEQIQPVLTGKVKAIPEPPPVPISTQE